MILALKMIAILVIGYIIANRVLKRMDDGKWF
jgi:hypothetical protein